MKSIIPYTKEIEFSSKIAEICSISLEHELQESHSEVNGNFIVSGEYKSHEVSVNKEAFSYKLPFSVEMTDQIDKDSIQFEITDFTYEIVNDNTLKVNIEFVITADEIESIDENTDEVRESYIEEINDLFNEPVLEEETTEERLDNESEELILNGANEKENEFATYHIHIVKDGDSVESICTTYQIDVDVLKEYNHLDNLEIGDKIIIPWLDE